VQDNPPEEPVKLLRITLHDANLLNITVVAAAGNDSWRDEYRTQPLGPQLPAAYPFVIGVAGSNANRQRSCFSNWGDVSAPAGDGAPGMVPVVSDTKPISIPSLCAASFETSLIGPVLKSERYPRTYARWNGTSFAAPLVSGLAALVLEAGAQPGGIWMQPDSVARAIKCGASAADGIINVPVTLMRCMGP
jgi:subtilisin family serine protease